MTDDYKERIIKWLTGNYDIEQSSTDPLFQELEETQTTLSTYMEECFGYIQGKDGKGNDLDIGFLYGNDVKYTGKGVILVVDKDFNILQVITEFDSGTKFARFIELNIDKTNGNIYGIDYTSSKNRFILLNNFLVKTPAQVNYEVKLRNSYFLEFSSMTSISAIDKKPNEAFYTIIGHTNTPSLEIATYKIEVGSTNELIEYDSTLQASTSAYEVSWSGDNYIIKTAGLYTSYSPLALNYKEVNFDGTNFTVVKDFKILENITNDESTRTYNFSKVIINNGEVYLSLLISHTGDSNISLYKVEGNDITLYRQIEQTNVSSFNQQYLYTSLYKKDNQVFYCMALNTDYSSTTSNINFTIEFGVISSLNGLPYIAKKTVENQKIYDMVYYFNGKTFAVVNTYNLYTYNFIGTEANKLLKIQQIYNPLNYNYEDYEDYNSMIPTSAWLYDDNDKLIYARNLYNKVVNGNTTLATVEVPNLLLNDVNIDTQNLLGGTNGILITNTDTITKNIYEDLFINFYNTLTMQNRNTQNYITNIVGASRLNSSISNIMDYNDTKIGKLRVNYSDDTNIIKDLSSATRISQFVYQFSFYVYVPADKDIISIEIMSNDEGTTYQTITGLNLIQGKSYKITQNVEIGE